MTENDLRKLITVEDEEDGRLTVIATDSVGNTTKKVILIGLNQSKPVSREEQGYIRFLSREAYNKATGDGGLIEKSVWYIDDDYKKTINEAFDNLENDTPEQRWVFTHDQVLEVQNFIDTYGFGKTKSDDALDRFYNQFVNEGCLKENRKGL